MRSPSGFVEGAFFSIERVIQLVHLLSHFRRGLPKLISTVGVKTVPAPEPVFDLLLQNGFQTAAGPDCVNMWRTGPAVLTVFAVPGSESGGGKACQQRSDLRLS